MKLNRKLGLLAIAIVLLVGAGIAIATGLGRQEPLVGSAAERASAAALAATGGGRVTETEVGENNTGYEIEVTLNNGHKVDVRLDDNFKVISQEADDDDDDEQGEAEDDADDSH